MGVLHPEQITHYSVSSINYVDYLRIVYDRPKGSLLPVSRTYHFPRVQKSAGSVEAGQPEVVMQRDPSFVAVLEELRDIVKSRTEKLDTTETMLDELKRLENDVNAHVENMRMLIERIQKS